MQYRVAFASSDGNMVDLHFGRADRFMIFEFDGESGDYNYVEERDVTKACHGGSHESDAFSQTAEALKDVSAIVVSRIGEGAAEYMESQGFQLYQATYYIEPLLQQIKESKLWEGDAWQYRMSN